MSDLKNCEFAEEAVGTAIMALWLVQSFIVLLNILIALVTIKFEESQVGKILVVPPIGNKQA